MKIGPGYKQSIFTIILELFLILVAVLLGLVVNEMRISHNEKQHTDKIIRYIITEINGNSERLSRMVPYHKSVKDSLEKLTQTVFTSENYHCTYDDLIKAMPRGFRVPLIETTGWELLNSSGAINNLELDLSIELSKIYNQQEFLQGKLDKIGENIYIASNNNLKELNNLILAYFFLINDILLQEERLLENYGEIHEKLNGAFR